MTFAVMAWTEAVQTNGLGSSLWSVDEGVDRGDEVRDAAEDAPSETLLGELPEPALDEVEPRRARGREVEHEAGMLLQPGADDRMLCVP